MVPEPHKNFSRRSTQQQESSDEKGVEERIDRTNEIDTYRFDVCCSVVCVEKIFGFVCRRVETSF